MYRQHQFSMGHSHHVGAWLEKEPEQCTDTVIAAKNLGRTR